MARTKSALSEPKPAQLSIGEMQVALPKLERRLIEIESFDPNLVAGFADTNASALLDKLNDTLVDIFGFGSLEYNRYSCSYFYVGGVSMGRRQSQQEIVRGYQKGKERIAAKLRTAIELLREKLTDLEVPESSSAPRSLKGIDLHQSIQNASGLLFRDGHYAEAVENACKALNGLVQAKSGYFDKDNAKLMHHVLSKNDPVLAFNELQDQSDLSVQEGMMHIYAGTFMAFRNPRAHRLTKDDAEYAFGTITMISFLAKLIEGTTIRNV